MDDETVYKWHKHSRSLKVIGKHLGMTEKEIDSENFGIWVVDYVKQLETAINLAKVTRMRSNPVQSVENYIPPIPKPPELENDIESPLDK